MKNITLSANESLIERAREKAKNEKTTLNNRFREWLENYASGKNRAEEYETLMSQLDYVKIDRKYSRDELNER